MNRYSNPRDAAPWEAGGVETGPGDRERERVPTDANFLIISRAVYYFSVTNNLEFNTDEPRWSAATVSAELSIPHERREERYNFNELKNTSEKKKKTKLSGGSLEN